MTAASKVILCLLLVPVGGPAAVEEPPPCRIVDFQDWSTAFGGAEITLRYEIIDPSANQLTTGWSIAVQGRVLVRRERKLTFKEGKATVEIPLKLPSVENDIILEASVSLIVFRGSTVLARSQKQLWLFPEDPFANRQQWLERCKITLFDPVGETEDLFVALAIPHQRAQSMDHLSRIDDGVIVVGEGINFTNNTLLGELLWEAAGRGAAVLILAPTEGRFPLQIRPPSMPPARIDLQRRVVLRGLDKRLDCWSWADKDPVACGFQVTTEDDRLIATVERGSAEWTWIRIDFSAPGRPIIACGFAIIEHWKNGPTPRYLLRQLFELTRKDVS